MTVETRPIEVPVRTKTPADVLRHAALIIEERGWIQRKYESETGSVCALGAIYTAYGYDFDDLDDTRIGDETDAERAMWLVIPASAIKRRVPAWNDAPGRTPTEVTAALRSAANAWDVQQ